MSYEEDRYVETTANKLFQEHEESAIGQQRIFEEIIKEVRSSMMRVNTPCNENAIDPASPHEFSDRKNNLDVLFDEMQKNMNRQNQVRKDIQNEYHTLAEKHERLGGEKKKLEIAQKYKMYLKSLAKWPWKKPRVTCQLYCADEVSTNAAQKYGLTELEKTLKTHLYSVEIDLEIKLCSSPDEISKALPTVVICFNYSRVGSVIKNALRGIEPGPNIAVLILHHKEAHALSPQKTKLTAAEYQGLGPIIDMAFLSDRGIYECEMNQKAIAELTWFIKSH